MPGPPANPVAAGLARSGLPGQAEASPLGRVGQLAEQGGRPLRAGADDQDAVAGAEKVNGVAARQVGPADDLQRADLAARRQQAAAARQAQARKRGQRERRRRRDPATSRSMCPDAMPVCVRPGGGGSGARAGTSSGVGPPTLKRRWSPVGRTLGRGGRGPGGEPEGSRRDRGEPAARVLDRCESSGHPSREARGGT